MKCYVVRDLLPEYEEHLCSAETKTDIEAHLAGCEACRRLYEELEEREDAAAKKETRANLEDIRPFAKIRRRMRRLTIRNAIVGIALLAVCAVFGVLTFFQFCPELGGVSFDTIKYYQKAKAIAKSFAQGDMETFLQGMLYGLDTGGEMNMTLYADSAQFYEDTLAALSALYDDALAGRDITVRVEEVWYYNTGEVSSYYNDSGDTHGCGYRATTKILADQTDIRLDLYMYSDDGYGVYMIVLDNEEDAAVDEGIAQCVDRVNFFQKAISYGARAGWELGLTSLWNADEEGGNAQGASALLAGLFAEDCAAPDADGTYTEALTARIGALMPLVTVNESRMSGTGYDPEAKKLTAVLFWSFTDQEGHSGILQKAFYYGPYGYEAMDDTALLLCEEGMDANVRELVRALFE